MWQKFSTRKSEPDHGKRMETNAAERAELIFLCKASLTTAYLHFRSAFKKKKNNSLRYISDVKYPMQAIPQAI